MRGLAADCSNTVLTAVLTLGLSWCWNVLTVLRSSSVGTCVEEQSGKSVQTLEREPWVRRGVPYQAIIEDDLLLEPGFPRFVERLTAAWLGARNEARPETLLETPADLRSPPAQTLQAPRATPIAHTCERPPVSGTGLRRTASTWWCWAAGVRAM